MRIRSAERGSRLCGGTLAASSHLCWRLLRATWKLRWYQSIQSNAFCARL